MRGWCDLPKLKQLTRTEIQDANDWIDALDEADEIASKKTPPPPGFPPTT